MSNKSSLCYRTMSWRCTKGTEIKCHTYYTPLWNEDERSASSSNYFTLRKYALVLNGLKVKQAVIYHCWSYCFHRSIRIFISTSHIIEFSTVLWSNTINNGIGLFLVTSPWKQELVLSLKCQQTSPPQHCHHPKTHMHVGVCLRGI